MKQAITGLLTFLAPAALAATTPAGTPVDATYFTTKVQPLLQQRCLGCHGVGNRLAGLDLRSRASALKGGVRGAALVPGSAAKSLLYKFISGERQPQMPPGAKLPAEEIRTLKTWLDGGAPWTDGSTDSAAKQVWWSFKKPELPRVPQPKLKGWVKNPIDAFVLAKLEENGLKPNPVASRRVLIRRAYMDLIGLPPAPEEVQAFEADKSPDAWEKVVDHLLASPHYGERWGRHWMDVVRFAESASFEGDKDRPTAWRYRDYIIDSFNHDKPYDQFVKEQIAGDEIEPGNREALIATGYLAVGPQDQVQKDAKTRAEELDDLVSTTGAAYLGLTLGCARCHDHKYDPVKQTDYYRLSAIFAPTERKDVDLPMTPEEQKAFDAQNAAVEKELDPLRARLRPLLEKATEAAKKSGKANPNEAELLAALSGEDQKQYKALEGEIKAVAAKRPQHPQGFVVMDKGREFPASHLLIRGDAGHPGQVVQPGFICSLPGGEATVTPAAALPQSTGRRKALAEWLASSENPLTARVWINRVWQHHFGRGIVASPSNFGLNGELPSHQELLDWLTVTFEQGGWKLKPIHRLILLSSTYKQSSDARPEGLRSDPLDKYLWRMPVRRLEAEVIRDSMLAAAGTLNPAMGGPPVYPPVDPSLRADTFLGPNWPIGEDTPATRRRSVYIKVKRSLIYPGLDVFDCPEITSSVANRNITVTPTQALMLLNDPLILKQAELFAERVKREAGEDARKQVERAYWLAVSRPPSEREIALGTQFLKTRSLAELCHTVLNLNEFVYVP